MPESNMTSKTESLPEYVELNLSNYSLADVEQLNTWGIWAHSEIERLHQALLDSQREVAAVFNAAVAAKPAPEPPQPGAKAIDTGELWSFLRAVLSQGKHIHLDYTSMDYELYSARLDTAALERVGALLKLIGSASETTDLNSCRARLHDISNGPLYDLQMSARREVGLAIDEARTAIARACHDLRRATTVAESSVGTASTQPLKAAASLPPCECLIVDKEPSAYHAVKCPRFAAGKL